MKTNLKKNLVLLFMSLCATAFILPASAQSAKLDLNNGVLLSLEETGSLQSVYEIPATDFGFKDVAVLDKYLGAISNNLIQYNYEAGDAKVEMQLHLNRSDKLSTVSDWNAYLAEMSTRYTDYRNRMNQ